MFLASSVSNLITISGTVDHFIDISNVPDSFAISLEEGDEDEIREYFSRSETLTDYEIIDTFKYGDGRTIAIDFYEEDYCQVIRVFNTGTVVTDLELPHLFDSFYRGSNVTDKPGNGLGLYISRQIMNKMDGEIFAERKENGMSFCMVFRL